MAISLTSLSTPITRTNEDSNAKQALKEPMSVKWFWKTSELVNAVGRNESMFNEIDNLFLSYWRLIYENQARISLWRGRFQQTADFARGYT